ncbi:class I SAM-dependent methyltransferase [Rossellomorea aquimaris]|uniref:class I SAM-dependent methyltransferase n=1 Tax=Rossellomorea aquimaris TaxID=189382 RepID=UPI0007D0822E|nr:class I SAM-dependent methyltransferase [Rossellomorea aquimaris]
MIKSKVEETIFLNDDVVTMLDSLLRDPTPFWDEFYKDRDKKVPFFINAPDENLVQYIENRKIIAQDALELGCGPGRNSIYLASKSCSVDAIDLSQEALNWAKERSKEQGVQVSYQCKDLFTLDVSAQSYDLVYDSGCLHHIPPHRRPLYVEKVMSVLKPGGHFGLTCFAADDEDDRNGTTQSDWDVYRNWSMKGGMAYSKEKLEKIFQDFELIEMRRMNHSSDPNQEFGLSFLWACLFQKK